MERKIGTGNNWKRFAYAAIAFVVIAAVYNFPGQVETYRQKRNLEKTFRDYSRALESGDYSGAYAYGDSLFKAAIGPQAFAGQQTTFESRLGALKSVREGGLYMHGRGSPMQWIGIVEEVRDYDKGKVHFACEFRLEDGRWQIFGCIQTD
jgi:hypothetical protein